MKKVAITLALTIISIIIFNTAYAADLEGINVEVKVLEVEDYEEYDEETDQTLYGQKVKIKVLTDNHLKDKEFNLDNAFEDDYYKQARSLHVGDKVGMILYIGEEGWVNFFYILNRNIYQHAIWLSALFFALLIIIGRKKGLKSAISLALTLAVVIFVMIPLLKNGYPPVLITVLSCTVVTIVTLLIVGGIGSKSYSAILGTLGGLLVAWVLSGLVANIGNMTAISTTEVELLMYNQLGIIYKLQGILVSGIIIGCLGAIMDVAMSISSTVHEVKKANNELTTKELFKAGMSVGCDIIGTMTNTLVLAYTGSALTMILVQSTYDMPIIELLNHDFIFVEVLRTLAGSIGMILAVPFTALLASFMSKKETK